MSCYGVTPVAASTSPVVLDWAAIASIIDDLATEVTADGTPDIIVGILRGGMIPAVRLAHALGVREVRALDVTHTVQDGANASKTDHPIVRNLASLGDLSGLDVLLVDDIAGSGLTMRACRSLAAEAGACMIRTAACVLNEANWPHAYGDLHDAFTYLSVKHRRWVVFPWENQ
jgi:hypoxanthine phosphoribosyltransferase